MQSKNAQQKTWKQTYLVDRKQIDSFSKDISKLFSFSASIQPWNQKVSKLMSQSQQAEIKIVKQQRNTFLRLSQIGTDISNLRDILKNFDQSNEYLVKVQAGSQNILGKLQAFRGKMAVGYEQLADQQDKLKEQLELINKKIQCMDEKDEAPQQLKENIKNNNKETKIWERGRKEMKSVSPPTKEAPISKLDVFQRRMKQKQREVEDIEKQIANLGKNLGWSEEDHKDFVSIWHRGSNNKNYFQIEEELKAYFQFYTGQQIQEHMNKYLKWRKLNQEKKEFIIIYKSLKQQKKVQELKSLNLQRDKSREEREKMQSRKRQQKQQTQMKGKIIQWKQAKQKEKQQEEKKKKKEQQERKRAQMTKRQELMQKRQIVDQWKEQQVDKKQTLKRVQSARKPAIDKQAEQRIRRREEQLIQKRKEIIIEKKREQELQKQKEVKIKQEKFVKFSHVANKLDHKTTAMKEKERQKFDGKDKKEANTFGGQLLMGGRATPAWLKGI